MMILLEGALSPDELTRVRTELEGAAWRDGKATAGARARAVKDNLQATGLNALGDFVERAMRRHPLFEIAARPRRFSRVMFSKYEPGMQYGPHTDDAVMGPDDEPMRTDLAFTAFLAEPEDYGGGALIVESSAGEQAIRLKAGDAVLYPAGSVHRVAPVTQGARLAAIGWVQSLVRDPGKREALFDLSVARQRLQGAPGDVLLLDKTVSNLLRMWAEV